MTKGPQGDGSHPDDEPFDRFKNERDSISRSGPLKATVAAMDWAVDEIERLRATSQTPDAVREADDNEMEKISKLIVRLQSVLDTWGDTCVYIRRGGLSWGAVALNRQADDKKHGVFDLQAQHDRDMEERLGQVGRLKADRDRWMERAMAAEALSTPSASAGPQAEADDFKLVYVKRWRTLVKLPTKYADEIVEALRAHSQPQQADGRGAVIEECARIAMQAFGEITRDQYVMEGPAGIARRMCNAIRKSAALQQSPATEPKP